MLGRDVFDRMRAFVSTLAVIGSWSKECWTLLAVVIVAMQHLKLVAKQGLSVAIAASALSMNL